MNELNELRYNIEERESMEQRRRELNKKLYLEEIIKKEKPTFESNNMILSPVGSGKSHLIENMLIPKDFNKKALYLTSNTSLKDSIAPNNNEVRKKMAEQGKSKGFYTTANKSRYGDVPYRVHVMTYSEFGDRMLHSSDELLKDVEIVFCDEIHSLPIYFNYDNNYKLAVAMFWLLKKQPGVVMYYFTATKDSISLLEEKTPGRLDDIKIIDYIDHPDIRKYVAKSTHYVSHIEQTRVYLAARKEAFDYYGYKALAFTRLIAEQEKIKKIAEEEGFKPLALWSVNNENEEMTDEQLKARDIILRTGLIPEPYNLLIINGAMQEGWNLFDETVTLAILDTVDLTEQIQALGRIRKDIDLVVKKTKDKELLVKSIIIPEKYLNKELTAEDKEELAIELNILNDKGKLLKWTSIKKLLIDLGYNIEEKIASVDNKRTRVSIINLLSI